RVQWPSRDGNAGLEQGSHRSGNDRRIRIRLRPLYPPEQRSQRKQALRLPKRPARQHLTLALALLALTARSALAGTHEEGRAVYNFRCYFCHGYSGDAKTLAATFLTPPPADFTSPAQQALGKESVLATLRQGRPGTAMKSFSGILSAEEMQAVA